VSRDNAVFNGCTEENAVKIALFLVLRISSYHTYAGKREYMLALSIFVFFDVYGGHNEQRVAHK
jgi:hypothetical protein